MEENVHAPWTAAQVQAINRFQRTDHRPMKCGEDTNHPNLVATLEGLECPACMFRQDWIPAVAFERAQTETDLIATDVRVQAWSEIRTLRHEIHDLENRLAQQTTRADVAEQALAQIRALTSMVVELKNRVT